MTRKSALSLISASALVASAVAQTGAECCASLSSALPDVVFLPGTDAYEASISRRWSNTAILPAACAFVPSSAEDVSTFFGIIVPGGCQFSIASGGHDPTPGDSGIDGGIAVDLQNFNQITLSADGSVVTLGVGQPWGDVYTALGRSGLGVPGALQSSSGVGGLSVGGGLAASSPRAGWTVDNILRYRIVLPSGEIVDATEEQNADLFVAQKGGGAMFGIVTEIDLQTFPLDNVWGGLIAALRDGSVVNGPAMADAVSQAVVDTIANLNDDDGSIAYFGQLYQVGAPRLVVVAVGNMDGVENPPALEPLINLPNQIQAQLGHSSLADFAATFEPLQPAGARQAFAAIHVKPDVETLSAIFEAGETLYDALPDDVHNDTDWIVLNGLLPAVQQTRAAANGGNSLGLSAAVGDQVVVWFSVRWTNADFDDTLDQVRDNWVELVSGIADASGALSPFVYLNLAGPTQDPYCGYGSASVANLRQVAAKYDPLSVMQTLASPGLHKLKDANC